MKKLLLVTFFIGLLTSCSKDGTNTSSSSNKLHADLWVDNIHYNINKDWNIVYGQSYEYWVKSFGSEEAYKAWLSAGAFNHPYFVTNAISDDKKDTFYINTIDTKKGGIGSSYSKTNNKINFIYPASFNSSKDTLNLKMNYNNNAKYLYDIRIEFVDSMLLLENNKYRKVPVKFSYK